MPALTNQKHENFAQLTVRGATQGLSQAQIYQMAGYAAEGHAAAMAASRLMKKDEVRARIAELTAPAERKTRTTVDTLTEQFDRVFDGAVAAEQFGAASNAAGLKARLLGFMRERIEIGPPGAFGDLTIEKVTSDMIEQLGGGDAASALSAFDEMIAEVRADLEGRAAAGATIVDPTPPPSNEAALGLAMLRPTPKGQRRLA
ncbi:hypothetical protein V1283_003787 [Bradyrhizobium sp. AZCC 2262]|uniref:hypothetical protein n=1 Tax=Bradyrhizobium sp. AZCC 2262 TaxID=3117022 RepID=UPI002FEF6562